MRYLLIIIMLAGCATVQPDPFTRTITVEIEYCPDGTCMPHHWFVGWASTTGKGNGDYRVKIKDVKALGHEIEHLLNWEGVWYNPDTEKASGCMCW